MTSIQFPTPRLSLPQTVFGAVGLALLTFVCFRLGLDLTTTGLVCLIAVTLLWVARLAGTAREGTEAARTAEAVLRRSEAYFRDAQTLSRTGSFGWDVATGEIFWSEEMFRILQYDRAVKPTLELALQRVHPEDAPLVKQTLERASRDRKDFDSEHRLLMPDGSVKHVHVVAHASTEKSGALEFVGATMDITAAREAEDRIQLIIDTVPVMIWTARPDGRCDFISQRWLDYTGQTLEHALGCGWAQSVHPDDVEQALSRWRAALPEAKPFEAEIRLRRFDGQYRWFLSRAFALRDRSGHVVGWAGNDIDIHDRRQAEERLRRSEAYLQEAQRLGHIGCFVRDMSSRITFVSPELLRIFGLCSDHDAASGPCRDRDGASQEILIEVPDNFALLERIHPEDRSVVDEMKNRSWSEKTAYELDYRIVLPDGSIRHCHHAAHPVFSASGQLTEYVGTILDVTERKQAAEVLERSKNRFRAMVEKSAEGILLMRPDRTIIYASPSVERVLGYTPEEFIKQSKQSPLNLVHLDYVQHTLDAWTQLLQDPDHVSTSEVMARHKDGSWRWIESTTRNLLHEPSVQALVTNYRDITERKRAQAERERLEQRLRQAEKMEAVGRLAGGIAHDFNNVLAGVLAYGEMLFEEAPEHSPLKRYAQNVLNAASRGRELVEQILAYSRSQRGKREPIDAAHVVSETLELIRGSLPARIRLEAGAPDSPQAVIGDATQLHQVVMNLCSNAIHAMSAGGGTLRVRLDTADVSAEQTLSHGALGPGRYVALVVEDTGSGMDAATVARIFEPFFTTKEVGQGTGLGLSLVYAIVTDSGGAIDVKSAPKQGSTFTIYLTRADVALAVTEAATGPLPRGGGERVLLVDDETPLLAVTAEVLSRLGYDAVSFDDSHRALAAFEAAPGRFDVVVTDEVMPGLTGTGLARALRRRRPDLPIVLVSGYSGPILTQDALAAGVSELLTKPLQSRDIATTLARVLHRAA
jgi:PAS domain S-box-containing protein